MDWILQFSQRTHTAGANAHDSAATTATTTKCYDTMKNVYAMIWSGDDAFIPMLKDLEACDEEKFKGNKSLESIKRELNDNISFVDKVKIYCSGSTRV